MGAKKKGAAENQIFTFTFGLLIQGNRKKGEGRLLALSALGKKLEARFGKEKNSSGKEGAFATPNAQLTDSEMCSLKKQKKKGGEEGGGLLRRERRKKSSFAYNHQLRRKTYTGPKRRKRGGGRFRYTSKYACMGGKKKEEKRGGGGDTSFRLYVS